MRSTLSTDITEDLLSQLGSYNSCKYYHSHKCYLSAELMHSASTTHNIWPTISDSQGRHQPLFEVLLVFETPDSSLACWEKPPSLFQILPLFCLMSLSSFLTFLKPWFRWSSPYSCTVICLTWSRAQLCQKIHVELGKALENYGVASIWNYRRAQFWKWSEKLMKSLELFIKCCKTFKTVGLNC